MAPAGGACDSFMAWDCQRYVVYLDALQSQLVGLSQKPIELCKTEHVKQSNDGVSFGGGIVLTLDKDWRKRATLVAVHGFCIILEY